MDQNFSSALIDHFSSFKDPKDRSRHFVGRSENIISYTVSKSVDVRKQEPTKHMMFKVKYYCFRGLPGFKRHGDI